MFSPRSNVRGLHTQLISVETSASGKTDLALQENGACSRVYTARACKSAVRTHPYSELHCCEMVSEGSNLNVKKGVKEQKNKT